MNRRTKRKSERPTQNLDSFLDILTNTVGVLMFISLFITLISVQASKIIHTPLVSQSPKKAHYFEVRGNRVIYLDDSEVDRELVLLMSSLPECGDLPNEPETMDAYIYQAYLNDRATYDACTNKQRDRIQNFQAQTKNYNVRLMGLSAISYEPAANAGESIREIARKDSEYRTILSNLNSRTDYIAFIVRQDSFSAFRAARQQAWQEGFDVGWEPQSTNKPIVFDISGSGGRSIGVQ